jgi:hypothetical protein
VAAKRKTKKAGAKKAGAKKAGAKKAKAPTEKSGPAGSENSKAGASIGVNLGHVFALRPRVSTSFRQADFNKAKHFLRDESYAGIEEAARAVAEKALELTHDGPSNRERRR